jgi:hypothetical protein
MRAPHRLLGVALAAAGLCSAASGASGASDAIAQTASAVGRGCETSLLSDWADGRIDTSYSARCYQAAAASLPLTKSRVADELRAEVAGLSRNSLVPAGQRGKRGAPRDPCPALDPIAPCPGALARFRTAAPLRLDGTLHTNAARSFASDFPTCGYRRSSHRLLFSSPTMRLAGGRVVRVSFTLNGYHGIGRYSATRPHVAYGRTPVQAATARNASTGAASAFFLAREGGVSISYSHDIDQQGHYGFLAGTVHATLIDARSGRVAALSGGWECSIDPVTNGPS